MKNCIICKKADGKYKCPTCLVYYCSVSCCNKHRKKKCKLVQQLVEQPPEEGNAKYDFETADTVPIKRLKLLEHDKDLTNMLGNPHLRNLLTTIDTSKEPQDVMQKAMLEPIFVEFADACLKVVEPAVECPSDKIIDPEIPKVESQSDN